MLVAFGWLPALCGVLFGFCVGDNWYCDRSAWVCWILAPALAPCDCKSPIRTLSPWTACPWLPGTCCPPDNPSLLNAAIPCATIPWAFASADSPVFTISPVEVCVTFSAFGFGAKSTLFSLGTLLILLWSGVCWTALVLFGSTLEGISPVALPLLSYPLAKGLPELYLFIASLATLFLNFKKSCCNTGLVADSGDRRLRSAISPLLPLCLAALFKIAFPSFPRVSVIFVFIALLISFASSDEFSILLKLFILSFNPPSISSWFDVWVSACVCNVVAGAFSSAALLPLFCTGSALLLSPPLPPLFVGISPFTLSLTFDNLLVIPLYIFLKSEKCCNPSTTPAILPTSPAVAPVKLKPKPTGSLVSLNFVAASCIALICWFVASTISLNLFILSP